MGTTWTSRYRATCGGWAAGGALQQPAAAHFTGPEYDHRHILMLLYSADRLARSLGEAAETALELLDQGSSFTAS